MTILPPMDINVIAKVKGNEKYIWMFYDCQRRAVMRSFGRFAANKDLSFDEADAVEMAMELIGPED